MQTTEIICRFHESVALLHQHLESETIESPLSPRGVENLPSTTHRSLANLHLEDLFEAELGRLIYGRSLLTDPATNEPLEVEHILQAFRLPFEQLNAAAAFIRQCVQTRCQALLSQFPPQAFITFWMRPHATVIFRITTGHG